MTYDFSSQIEEWRRVPVDDVGYIDSKDLLSWGDDQLLELVHKMSVARYGGWRNHNGLWRKTLGLDSTDNKKILDFGCGIGLEASEFGRRGCSLTLVDISWENLLIASRVVRLQTDAPLTLALATDAYPFFWPSYHVDVFYANGSLHHIPYAHAILERACEILEPDGEIRLMLYSDRARDLGGVNFVRAMDEVGSYADWYDAEKIEREWGDFLKLEQFTYITPDERYCTAILRRAS